MKIDMRGMIVIGVLAIAATLACSLPFNLSAQATPTQSAPASGLAQSNPATLSPTLAINNPATLEPALTDTPRLVDLSSVSIGLPDLPQGFTELDSASQKQIGVTQDTVAGLFQGTFSQARPVNFFSFLNANPDTYQFVLGTLFTPLTVNEIQAFDRLLDDPARAMQSFTAGMGGKADLLQGANGMGEKSIGFTFTTELDTMTLRGDMLLVRRKDVVFLVLSMYQDGTQPLTQANSIAKLLDQRLVEAQAR
jgi:hypothetical protein